MAHEQTFHCSFCGKNQHQVMKIIVADNAAVCDECIERISRQLGKDPGFTSTERALWIERADELSNKRSPDAFYLN